jgi:N-hydroxyarylamine O-acetyltransferase
MSDGLDLGAYLDRIDYSGERRPTRDVLDALHLAHATHIPFENLDVLLGKVPRLDLASLQAKLVRGGRGGYCFEQNLLFAAALEAIGFAVTPLAARVRYGSSRVNSRTHMVLLVAAEGSEFLADVGFGGDGLLYPLPFPAGREHKQGAWTYRLAEEPGAVVLQSLGAAGWSDLYAFTREPQHLVDYELGNYWIATHPDSPFTQRLTAQLPTPGARYILRGREFTIDRGSGNSTTRTLADAAEVRAVLADTFGLHLPPEATPRL